MESEKNKAAVELGKLSAKARLEKLGREGFNKSMREKREIRRKKEKDAKEKQEE